MAAAEGGSRSLPGVSRSIRFPAVPIKSARLRIQMNAGHRREHIDHLVDVLERNQHLAEPARSFVAAGGNMAAGA